MTSAAEVVERLNEAGATLLSVPHGAGRANGVPWEILNAVEDTGFAALGNPTRAQIKRMNEALGWISLIPRDRYVLRRIVGARALISPATKRHVYPWRRLAALLGADHKAVQRWHAQGIALIAAALADRGTP